MKKSVLCFPVLKDQFHSTIILPFSYGFCVCLKAPSLEGKRLMLVHVSLFKQSYNMGLYPARENT